MTLDLGLVADLRGLLARDVLFALPDMRTGPGGVFIMMPAPIGFMIFSLINVSS
jgi:hypothetical protein